MDADDNPKAGVRKYSLTSSKTSMVIGSVAVLAVCILAGLVFTRYEAGIPPAEAAPTSAQRRFIHVTVSEQNPAIRRESSPRDSRHAAATEAAPSEAFGALGHHTPAVAGAVCSAEGPVTS
jgi:hypothetical protein